jgi:hypothetical protein
MTLKKIISGGQTGADRGALVAALETGFPYGGKIPKGRKAEDGKVPDCFDQLEEISSADYKVRTRENVRDSTGTLVVCPTAPMSPGSQVTVRFCHEQGRPVIVREARKVLADPHKAALEVLAWVKKHGIGVLNVAGTRESKFKGIQEAVRVMMSTVLAEAAKN